MAFKTVIRIAKLGTIGNLKASGEHTWRERKTDNADPERTHLNEDWREVKSSAELVDAVQNRVAQAEQKSDHAVPCIEYLITAHKDAFKEGGGEVDSSKYFADSLKWLEAKHGKENIVAVNIQRDEQTPHMVAYVVPLVEVAAKTRKRSVVVGKDAEGKQIREIREYKEAATSRLSASEFFDSRQKLRDLQTDFSKDVGAKHGLERGVEGSTAKHQTIKQFYTKLNDTEKAFNTAKTKAARVEKLEGLVEEHKDVHDKNFVIHNSIKAKLKAAREEAAEYKRLSAGMLDVLQNTKPEKLPLAVTGLKTSFENYEKAKVNAKTQPEAEKKPPQTPQKER